MEWEIFFYSLLSSLAEQITNYLKWEVIIRKHLNYEGRPSNLLILLNGFEPGRRVS